MYKIRLAVTEEEILEFENLRNKVFYGTKPIEKTTQSPYAQAIEEGDLLAFRCLEEDKLVGGMLVGLQGNSLEIMRLFVDKPKREKGAGTYMVGYLDTNRGMLEDYYGTEIDGVYISPTLGSIDYCFEKGFSCAGHQMFKKYEKRGSK